MSLQRVNQPHCWVIELNSEGDEIHFPTAQAAAEYVTSSGHTGADPAELPVPCWTATCDGDGCSKVERNEDGDEIHIPAYTFKHALADLHTLELVDGRLLCQECADTVKIPAPAGHRPPILTEEDLSRVFVATAMYAELFPGARFDEETEGVLKVVQALVIKAATARSERQNWTARVLPFAIQSPLPGMPRIPAAVVEGSAR